MVTYGIEEHEGEWVVYVHGFAILRCAQPDVAQEVVRMAQALLGETEPAVRCGDNGLSLSMRR